MIRAEYGVWIDEIDDIFAYDLTRSYIRRQRFTARLIAEEVAITLFGAEREQEISTEAFYAMTPEIK